MTSEREESSAEAEVKQQQGDGGSGGGTGDQCASESRESGTVKSEGLASEQEEAMETQPGNDDEQPKRKPTAATATRRTNTESRQTSISDPSQASQTGLSTSTMGRTSDDADIPYFPAHPISYFPDDVSSSSSVSARPPQRAQPASIFDSQFSLFSIAEDGPVVGVQTLEPFAVGDVESSYILSICVLLDNAIVTIIIL